MGYINSALGKIITSQVLRREINKKILPTPKVMSD